MSLKDDIVNDSAIIFNADEFGDTATYTRDPLEDNEQISTVVVQIGNRSLSQDRQSETASFEIRKDIFADDDRPRYRDTIQIGSEVPWTVEDTAQEDVMSFIVNCRRLERGKY